jgi:exopolysaccharide biosynthesis polyprenyl glycosylphosphotransferase
MVAGQLVNRLRAQRQFGLDPIGLIDDDYHHADALEDLPSLGRLEDLPGVLRRHQIDRVIIAFSRADHGRLLESIRACRLQQVAVDVVPRLFEFLEGARGVDQIGGLPVLSIGAPRLSRSSRAAKRSLDIVGSLLALSVLSPLLLLIALAVKRESEGSVLFRQPRAGRDGRVFRLIKFRSMYMDAEARKLELVDANEADDDVMFKIRDDPRVTRVGRLLRKTSLDELPQFVNVLRGDMSLVGPRPLILPESEALGEGWHARRLDLRPGITGPWQISGRSDVSVHDMVRLDFQYVTGWSLTRDIEILLATVPVLITGRGAY